MTSLRTFTNTQVNMQCVQVQSLSQIQCCLMVNIRKDATNISQSYPYHRCYCSIMTILLYYLYQKPPAEGCADLQADIDTLQSILNGTVTHIGTQFESPCTECTNWSENDWTKRLVYGIKAILSKCDVKYAANLGLN